MIKDQLLGSILYNRTYSSIRSRIYRLNKWKPWKRYNGVEEFTPDNPVVIREHPYFEYYRAVDGRYQLQIPRTLEISESSLVTKHSAEVSHNSQTDESRIRNLEEIVNQLENQNDFHDSQAGQIQMTVMPVDNESRIQNLEEYVKHLLDRVKMLEDQNDLNNPAKRKKKFVFMRIFNH